MAPLPAVAKVLKIALVWTDGVNDDIVSRFFVRYSGVAPTDSDLATFGGAINTAYSAHLASLAGESVSLTRSELVDLSSATAAAADVPHADGGSRTGHALPIDVSVVISYIMGRRYRGGHPRGYFPFGVSEDLNNLQVWQTDFVTEVDGAWTDFFVALEAAGWAGAGTLTHVNISYYAGFTVVIDPVTGRARNLPTLRGAPVVDNISSHVVRAHVGTQRRRLQY